MPKIVYPAMDVGFPVQRGELLRLAMLIRGQGYLVDEKIALTVEQFAAESVIVNALDCPPGPDIERLLLLFPGGIGDVLCMRSCLEHPELREKYPALREIGFVSFIEDRYLIGGSINGIPLTIYDYPVAAEVYAAYDGCVSYSAVKRESIHKPLWASFSEGLALPMPIRATELVPDPNLRRAMAGFLKVGRRHIGIQMTSPSFYKSWHPPRAYELARELADLRHSVYIIGGPGQRLDITQEDKRSQPHAGIYDVSGLLRNSGELIAFVSHMDGLVTIDSGVMHIAGCLEKPTVALFGLTDAESRMGLYPSVTAIEGRADCSPCWNVSEVPTCGEPYCKAIADIPAAEIIETLTTLIG